MVGSAAPRSAKSSSRLYRGMQARLLVTPLQNGRAIAPIPNEPNMDHWKELRPPLDCCRTRFCTRNRSRVPFRLAFYRNQRDLFMASGLKAYSSGRFLTTMETPEGPVIDVARYPSWKKLVWRSFGFGAGTVRFPRRGHRLFHLVFEPTCSTEALERRGSHRRIRLSGHRFGSSPRFFLHLTEQLGSGFQTCRRH